jgi:hypothetical protein
LWLGCEKGVVVEYSTSKIWFSALLLEYYLWLECARGALLHGRREILGMAFCIEVGARAYLTNNQSKPVAFLFTLFHKNDLKIFKWLISNTDSV